MDTQPFGTQDNESRPDADTDADFEMEPEFPTEFPSPAGSPTPTAPPVVARPLQRSPSPPGIALEPEFVEGLPKLPKEILGDNSEWNMTDLMRETPFLPRDMCEDVRGTLIMLWVNQRSKYMLKVYLKMTLLPYW